MYELETAIVDELNVHDDVKFALSERTRQSMALMQKQGVVDYAKIDLVDGKQVLRIVLVKNFALKEFNWQAALKKAVHQVRSKLANQEVGTRYSFTRGKYLDQHELIADIGNQWGATKGEDHQASAIATALVNATIKKGNAKKVAQLLTSGDADIDDQMAYRFTTYVNSQPTVIFPKQVWRSIGLSEIMRNAGVKLVFPEVGSDLVALSRAEFEQVALQGGWTVTENPDDAKLLSKPIKPYAGPAKSAAAQNAENRKSIEMRFNSMMSNDPTIRLVDLLLSGKPINDESRYTNDPAINPSVIELINKGDLSPTDRKSLEQIRKDRVTIINDMKLMAKSETPDITASPLDAATSARRNLSKENLKVINSKVILIAPRSNYFIIKSIAGQALPIY